MRPGIAALLLLALSACPKEVPPDTRTRRASKEAAPPLTEDQRLEQRIAVIANEAVAYEREIDEALWAAWTTGAPLDLEKTQRAHAALLSESSRADVATARAHRVGNPLGMQRLERWLAGQRLAEATAGAAGAITELEARLTFKVADKEVRWRDLGRLLANEKSAVKRKALWTGSREAVKALSEAYRARDEAAAGAEASAAEPPIGAASRLLDVTELEWKLLLEQLAKSELGLAVDKLGREDLPRLLRPSALAEVSFAKQDEAAKATALLKAIGLDGQPGLTLELTESPKKKPVPLTVAVGGPADVRVCFRPGGGVRDFGALLAELGRGLAIHDASDPASTLPGLASFPEAEAAAVLFGQLVESPAELRSFGVSEADAPNVARSQRAFRLFAARRAAGTVLAQSGSRGQSEEVTAELWRTWSIRALGIPVAAGDELRWRLETDPFGRAALQVDAFMLADRWKSALPGGAWKDPATAAVLRADWAEARRLELDVSPPDAGSWPVEDAGVADAGRAVDGG